jgi:cysteine synthase A
MGIGRALRRKNPAVRIVAMEPAEAAMLRGEMPCLHAIEGIADGFIPPLMDRAEIDETVKVASDEALAMTQRLMLQFGLPVGTSSGGNVVAALRTLERIGRDKVVVTVLCDRSERYFSTRLFGIPGESVCGTPAGAEVH